jgi:hypothetical protein
MLSAATKKYQAPPRAERAHNYVMMTEPVAERD